MNNDPSRTFGAADHRGHTMTDLEILELPTQFPQFFPPRLEKYRRALAESIDAPDEYAVAYMLAAAATATGANVSACVQADWCVRANLFVAIIGHKGTGKSLLEKQLFAPLVAYEQELRERFAAEGGPDEKCGDGEDSELDGSGHPASRQQAGMQPCVIVNDCTGPAVLKLLADNDRQLLVNPDELSTQFIRNTGGTDRQMWCELYDGRRRNRARASTGGSSTLAAPYVCVLGGMQPELFRSAYGKRGDDGLLDRYLLVGDGVIREARWPSSIKDLSLHGAWQEAIERLLRVEELAADVMGGQVEARFTPEAREVCERFLKRLNHLVVAIGVPAPQRGVVKKLSQHALKLALLHRCLRWAVGEFGEPGAFGDVDAFDASAACEATLFFLGRWLIWRPELGADPSDADSRPVGLAGDPGDDPALTSLALEASAVQAGIHAIERVIRHARCTADGIVRVTRDAGHGYLVKVDADEVQNACEWLVARRQGEWVDEPAGAFRLFARSRTGPRRRRGRTSRRATPT